MTDPIQHLWAAADADARPPAPDVLHTRSRQLLQQVRRRDAVEYLAALLVVLVFGYRALVLEPPLLRLGSVLIVLGTFVIALGLWRRRPRARSDAAAVEGTKYLRAQLMEQRDALASVARWYLAPVVPGLVVFLAGSWLDQAARGDPLRAALVGGIGAVLVIVVFVGVWWLNRRAARQLDAEIGALDRSLIDP